MLISYLFCVLVHTSGPLPFALDCGHPREAYVLLTCRHLKLCVIQQLRIARLEAMAQDGFSDWLRETFATDLEGLDDVFVADQALTANRIEQSQPMLPDTAVLIQHMQNSLTQHDPPELADVAIKQEYHNSMQSASEHNKAEDARAGSQRPKNTKRYKSLAQKQAHKRYRERKRASITAMEHTVSEMLQQLKQLEAENEQLKSKCRVLETSVNCSTQIHGIMQLLQGINGLSVNSDDSYSPASGSRSVGHFGLQAMDRMNSTAASDTSGGDTWSSDSGLLLQQQQQQQQQQCYPPPLLQQQQMQDPWQRVAQSRVVTTGNIDRPAAAATVSLPASTNNVVTGFHQVWNAVHSPQQQQQHTANALSDASYGSGSSNGSSKGSWATRPAAQITTSTAAAPAGPLAGGSVAHSNADDLRAILAEAQQQQQQQQDDASNSPHLFCDSPHHPLAGAVTSVEQGMRTYKNYLTQASQLLLQIDAGGPDAETATATLEELTKVTMSRLQPLLVAQGQGLVYNWSTRNLETGLAWEPPDGLWPKVLEQMKLSPQQQQDALACYRMFSICLSKLVDKRVELSAQYKALQQHSEQCELIAQQPQRGKTEAAADYRKVKLTSASMEVLQSLAKNLAAYQSLDGVFAHSVTSLLTGVQMAAACVHSYPSLPQWHTMMRLLMRREEAKQQALQEAAAGKAAPRRSSRSRSSVQGEVVQ